MAAARGAAARGGEGTAATRVAVAKVEAGLEGAMVVAVMVAEEEAWMAEATRAGERVAAGMAMVLRVALKVAATVKELKEEEEQVVVLAVDARGEEGVDAREER